MSFPKVWGDSFVFFAVFASATALLFVLRRRGWISLRRHWVLFFLPMFGSLIWGVLWWRENVSLRALSRIVDVPEASQAYSPPNAREMKFLARTAVRAPQPDAFISRQDREELSKTIEAQGDYDMWVIETPLSPPEVRRFYEDVTHRRGWQIVGDVDVAILLRGTDESMAIGFSQSRSGKGTTVTYFMHPDRNTAKN
jgi:hypothetical protein